MKRRSFLRAVGGAVGAGTVGPRCVVAETEGVSSTREQSAGLPRRALGRTGEHISVVGFPGLGLVHEDQPRGTALIHDAFDRGVNYFDVAPAYGNGDAEIKLGIGLQGIDRSKIFLACKTRKRDKAGAQAELDRSLKRLKTDHFDLYQMHCLIREQDDVERAFGPDGAMETIVKAKEQGKVRFVGFSAHTTKAALAALQRYRFDTVMFPINFIEYFTFGFGKQVLQRATAQGAGVLAIKPMCGGDWTGELKQDRKKRSRNWWYRPLEDPQRIDLALRFTLSLKPVAAGIPPAFLDLLDKAIEVGRAYRPITEGEKEQLRQLAGERASVFRDRQQVAGGKVPREPVDLDSPHEGCPGMYV